MEDRETPWMRKYVERKTTRIMMATVPHVTAWAGRTKYHADGFLFDWMALLWLGFCIHYILAPLFTNSASIHANPDSLSLRSGYLFNVLPSPIYVLVIVRSLQGCKPVCNLLCIRICFVEFSVTQKQMVGNRRVKFDREVNVYILYTERCS